MVHIRKSFLCRNAARMSFQPLAHTVYTAMFHEKSWQPTMSSELKHADCKSSLVCMEKGYRLSFIHRFPAEFSAVDGPEDGNV